MQYSCGPFISAVQTQSSSSWTLLRALFNLLNSSRMEFINQTDRVQHKVTLLVQGRWSHWLWGFFWPGNGFKEALMRPQRMGAGEVRVFGERKRKASGGESEWFKKTCTPLIFYQQGLECSSCSSSCVFFFLTRHRWVDSPLLCRIIVKHPGVDPSASPSGFCRLQTLLQ